MFRTWGEVQSLDEDVEVSLHEKFKSRAEARTYVRNHRDHQVGAKQKATREEFWKQRGVGIAAEVGVEERRANQERNDRRLNQEREAEKRRADKARSDHKLNQEHEAEKQRADQTRIDHEMKQERKTEERRAEQTRNDHFLRQQLQEEERRIEREYSSRTRTNDKKVTSRRSAGKRPVVSPTRSTIDEWKGANEAPRAECESPAWVTGLQQENVIPKSVWYAWKR